MGGVTDLPFFTSCG